MAINETHENVALYQRLLRALNNADYGEVAEVIAPAFEDHHPGFDVHGLEAYQDAVRSAHDALRLHAELDEALAVDDKVITRCHLTGEHLGTAMGMPATGRRVAWTTTEIWRVADGKLVERWAQDDLLGLREQLGLPAQLSADTENIELIRHLNDVVNERRYDDMDELFASSFVDHNPAWSVRDLAELKDIMRSAHEALDFTSHQDLIYVGDGGKVIIHITCIGRHVKPFFGQDPTGEGVRWTSIEVFQFENGKIAERWVQADTTGLMRQVGVPLP